MKIRIILALGLTALATMLLVSFAVAQDPAQVEPDEGDPPPNVVKAFFPDQSTAYKAVISYHDKVLESDYEKGYIVLEADAGDVELLTGLGFELEETTYDVQVEAVHSFAQAVGIPGYPCYRTVEETFNSAQSIANSNPTLASWNDIGNSWQKTVGQGGYDLYVLKLTNTAVSGPKPKLIITSAIHAREYSTAELMTRFAEYLINNYGTDADVTWLLDYHEIHLILQTNPDGRKQAEAGQLWRKNTNQNYCGSTSSSRGADLNRNFSFKWGGGGSSGNQCSETYRGPSPASEPEVQTVQNYLKAQFPDQRGPNDNDPAPANATGIYIDIHSHGRLVLWPWGYGNVTAPNATALQTLGRKLAYSNNHSPEQAIGLYPADGTTIDFAYGEQGVASYVFELGTSFFQGCSYFENTIMPGNMPSLLYAAKAAGAPYQVAAGPETTSLSVSNPSVPAGTSVTLNGTVDDTQYNNSNGSEPTQNIAAAEYYIDTPPGRAGAVANGMQASDGSFNSRTEGVRATIDTSGLSNGQHTIFVRGRDASGNWGTLTAVFLNITGSITPTPTATTTVTPGECLAPAWSVVQEYNDGDVISFNNHDWQASLSPVEPGTNGQWGVWIDLGLCDMGTVTPTPTATFTPTPTSTPTDPGGSWQAGTTYSVGDQVTYGGSTYQCLQGHTAYVGWEPPNVPALWQLIN